MITTINPATDRVINKYEVMNEQRVDNIILSCSRAQSVWKEQSYQERAIILYKVAGLLEAQKQDCARLITEEMGKPFAQAIAEVEKCALVCRYYADYAEQQLADESIPTEAQKSYVTYQPLGTVLAIMPWNFPFWQVFRCAAPILMAGNAMLLKHAENTTGCSLKIENIFREAGLNEGLFRSLVIPVEDIARVIRHQHVHAVTFTGSTRAGRIVASQAGAALKPVVLELGGSDPYIILNDANLDQAVELCSTSRLLNNGQSCIAGKRFIVEEGVYDQFVSRLAEKVRSYQMGNPLDSHTSIGPMARKDLRDDLHTQVLESIEHGASCILGGDIPDREGSFYPVTILEGIKPGMPAYDEELFGPVFSLIKVKDEEEAVRVANDTNYGLGAAIFSKNEVKAEELASRYIQAGSCFINDYVRSDPRLPFGGIKDSGFGRELSAFGIKEFVNIKTVYLK